MTIWKIWQSNERCKSRVKMSKTWKYKYCCIFIANQDNTAIRDHECEKEKCPIKIEVPEE